MQKVYSINIDNINTEKVTIKNKIIKGMAKFSISGANTSNITNMKSKLASVLNSNGLKYPYGKIMINFSPFLNNKNDSHLELPILISLISNQVELKNLYKYLIVGSLDIYGNLVEIQNPHRFIYFAMKNNMDLIIPKQSNLILPNNIKTICCENLIEVIKVLQGKEISKISLNSFIPNIEIDKISLNDIISQPALLRALIIAISGKHKILITGPVGNGKSISIKAVQSILPGLSLEDSILASDIYSRYFNSNKNILSTTFNYLNSNITISNLYGNSKKMGQIVLSNFGFFILEEINHFSLNFLNSLKSIMDNLDVLKKEHIKFFEYPVNFGVIATMNPCPCGNFGTKDLCKCSVGEINRYTRKIDKALLDRFDIKIHSERVEKFSKNNFDIENVKQKIQKAIEVQELRYSTTEISNGTINSIDISRYFHLNTKLISEIEFIRNKFNLSQRSVDNIIKVSRTIADFEGEKDISLEHIYEAVKYNLN